MTVRYATMMDNQATIQTIFDHGAQMNRAKVAAFNGSDYKVAHFEETAIRTRRLAAALISIGVAPGDPVATFCSNHLPHLEAYLAVPCIGAVLHTLNIRLHIDQLEFIMAEMEDKVLIADSNLLGTLKPLLSRLSSLKAIIVIGSSALESFYDASPDIYSYDTFVAEATPLRSWPVIEEGWPAVACYTSGTTGLPKGIVYSHRSIFMHSLATMGVDTFAISHRDRILLLPSMFHANAWGLPYTAWFAGADLILPGPHLQAPYIQRMIADWRPTFTAMVPTLINDLLQADEGSAFDLSSFRVIVSGGSAVSQALIEKVRNRWGVDILQGWGMTETSPICCVSHPPIGCAADAEIAYRAKSGRPVPGMSVRLRGSDGEDVAWDGASIGELQLRGPWVTGSYYAGGADRFTADGWLRTGDMGTIDPEGYVQVRDRAKELIKSGGEWISSLELEARLAAVPSVREVAVIGIADPRWEERPLGIVVLRADAPADPSALRQALEPHVARFWLPEYWSFVSELPKTSVGKIDKNALRQDLAAGRLSVVRA